MVERDLQLRARLAAGDDEAIVDVFEEYGPLVVGLARRVTGNVTTAEDVAQEVFVALWRFPDRFDPARGSLRGYLCLQAESRALDALRRDVRRSAGAQRQGFLESRVPHAAHDTESAAEAAVRAGIVRDAIRQLPADQREVVELAYFAGRSHSEVASILRIPLGTAKGRLRLAQARLRRLLSPEMAEPA